MAETEVVTRRSRFVEPDTTRIDLSYGDWIEVKSRLDFGERQALAGSGLRQSGSLSNGDTPDFTIDLAGYKIERMLAYLVDWSFRDRFDHRVTISRATVRALDPDTADEIDAALDAHIEGQAANPTSPNGTKESP
jgi:hypothetical protein